MPVNELARTTISGWGRYPKLETLLRRPDSLASLQDQLADSGTHSSIARGLGRSYGDTAVNPFGQTILMQGLNRILGFDETTGTLCCEAGVTLEQIIDRFLPRGWFLHVVPGTKYVTLGGAIANDIHGKNHYCDGTFCQAVKSFKLLCANGQIVNCSCADNSDIYWATIGGMGLTGVITQVELVLRRVPSAYINSFTVKAKDLDGTLAAFENFESDYQYTAAWIDCLGSNRSLGRSIIFFGNHAQMNDLPAQQRLSPFYLPINAQYEMTFDLPNRFLNRYSIATFNKLYWLMHQAKPEKSLVNCLKFFFPLDRLQSWNRLYGRKGFIQYQCVLPWAVGRESLLRILQLQADENQEVFLAVLKRLGDEHGFLSFPKKGYTLAIDLPVSDSLLPFIARLNQIVTESGGRVYLAKDAYMKPDEFRSMYPHYPQWRSIKNQIDPENLFRSALSDRLQLGFE
jgi:FAD/FMN-containing dehydrogenase